ncbi:rho guanine nucleotide exchange factor 1b isoform X2 [Latimeria chalumnae]|uniref:rho guanine nucleotide exchange factor 1b isoform X2 n=1 Tax=Latimeria chalumnae TaxID=7897 RepID=UPI00313CAF9D
MDPEDNCDTRFPFGAHTKTSATNMLIIGAEDEDFENDLDPSVDDQCSHFQSIELVKRKPTHLMVFLHHVILQFEPAPTLCYLHGELFKTYSPKEAKKQFVEFYNTFLDKGAPLRVVVPPKVAFELDRTRPELLAEDQQRGIVREVQSFQENEIFKQLEDFRTKRMMGMTPGEKELVELDSYCTNDKSILDGKEKQLAEQLMLKLEELQPISPDEEKCTSIFNAIVTYMKHLGVKTKVPDSKKGKVGFFRKKIPLPVMNKRDEPNKQKKSLPSILAPWNRSDSQNVDYRSPKVDTEEKSLPPERKNSQASKPVERSDGSNVKGKAGTEVPEASGVAVTVHPPPGEHIDGEPGGSGFHAGGESPATSDTAELTSKGGASHEKAAQGEHATDERGENERLQVKLGRSESLRVYERQRSKKGSTKGKQPRSRSDVDLEAAAKVSFQQEQQKQKQQAAVQTPSQGPQTPEPGGSGSGDLQQSFLSPQSEGNEPPVSELEMDPPNWRDLVHHETLLRLKKSEIKRQEVINELFITEHAHVRMLRVLNEIFYQPFLNEMLLTQVDLANIFPSLEELIELHTSFYDNLKKLRQENDSVVTEIGGVLLARFDGPEGLWFQKLSARFSSHQSYALDRIKQLQKRDARFNAFIQYAESKPQCRRLQLKDIIPIEMQRLTKYPLLLENIAKCTDQPEEKHKVQDAAECCRRILDHVNQEVREMENLLRLREYQRRLDVSGLRQSNEFNNIDLTTRTMIHEGPLTWRVTKDKTIDVYVLLLSDILVLLQKQDDKMVVKIHSRSTVAPSEGKEALSPIIKLNSVMTRDVATDRKAFYVIFTMEQKPQIYELVASTTSEQKNWCALIKKTVESVILQDAKRATMIPPPSAGLPPTSPTFPIYREVIPGENGCPVKEALQVEDKDKDGALEGRTNREGVSWMDEKEEVGSALRAFLTANGVELHKPRSGQETEVAKKALEEVSMLKRLLVRNIRLSEEQPCSLESEFPESLPEGGHQDQISGASPHRTQEEGRGRPEGDGREDVENVAGEDGNVDGEENGKRKGFRSESRDQEAESYQAEFKTGRGEHLSDGEGVGPADSDSLSAPIVLSEEQSQEVRKKMSMLENTIRHLKEIEEEYCHLQQLISRFTSPQDNHT